MGLNLSIAILLGTGSPASRRHCRTLAALSLGERRSNRTILGSTRPGDHVLWKNEDGRRFAVVQSVDPDARTAKLHLEDSNTTELAPILELDPNGSGDPSQNDPTTAFDGFGVRRGDFVFIHREGTTNGCVKPRVPRIGELEPWVRELPIYKEEFQHCSTVVWRTYLRLRRKEIGHRKSDDSNISATFRKSSKRSVST